MTEDELKRLMDKMDYAPGVPLDRSAIPTLRYQVLQGRVHTLQVWQNGSTARGMVEPADLEAVRGRPLEGDGWYDALGEYLGDDARLPQPAEEPAFPE